MGDIYSNPQYIWLFIAVVLFILEAATVNLITIWFGFGAICAMIAAMLGCSLPVQIGVFAVASAVLLLFTRKIVNKISKEKSPTNADRIIGKDAVVTESINNLEGKGQIVINGMPWTARSEKEEPIEKGSIVIIKEISGVKAIVALK